MREDGERNRREKKNSVYQQNPSMRFKKGVDVKHDTKLIPIIHLHKTEKTAIRKTTYLPRKSVEKGVKELRRNKTHIL